MLTSGITKLLDITVTGIPKEGDFSLNFIRDITELSTLKRLKETYPFPSNARKGLELLITGMLFSFGFIVLAISVVSVVLLFIGQWIGIPFAILAGHYFMNALTRRHALLHIEIELSEDRQRLWVTATMTMGQMALCFDYYDKNNFVYRYLLREINSIEKELIAKAGRIFDIQKLAKIKRYK